MDYWHVHTMDHVELDYVQRDDSMVVNIVLQRLRDLQLNDLDPSIDSEREQLHELVLSMHFLVYNRATGHLKLKINDNINTYH